MIPAKRLMVLLCGWYLYLLSAVGQAEEISILAPDLPGASEPGGLGRDAETVKQVLRRCGYQVEFLVQPFGRHMVTYRDSDKADGVMTVPLETQLPGGSTAAYIWYQNGAIYDADRIASITSLEDLHGRDVVTFKNGVELLGLEDSSANLGSIMEIANQRIHSHLLMLGRVDAILADGLIVAEINRRILLSNSSMPKLKRVPTLKFAPIFAPAPFKLVFREPEMALVFDRCFDRAYTDGVVTEINEKYIYRFQQALGHRYLGF